MVVHLSADEQLYFCEKSSSKNAQVEKNEILFRSALFVFFSHHCYYKRTLRQLYTPHIHKIAGGKTLKPQSGDSTC